MAKLNPDQLKVESFDVLPDDLLGMGTVHAFAYAGDPVLTDPNPVSSPEGTCGPPTCGYNTCGFTCPNTCKFTCDDATCIPNTGCHTGPCNCGAAAGDFEG